MSTLGFDKYVEPLKIYLFKYRDSVKGEKPEKKSITNKKSSNDSYAQPKKSMQLHDSSHDSLSMQYGSHALPNSYHQPYNPVHHQPSMGGMAMSYNSYGGAVAGAPPSGVSFMVDHSAPLVAPGKGEVRSRWPGLAWPVLAGPC
jgi:hypothetical protein